MIKTIDGHVNPCFIQELTCPRCSIPPDQPGYFIEIVMASGKTHRVYARTKAGAKGRFTQIVKAVNRTLDGG